MSGTKWCGDGNKAKNDDELGRYSEVDKCCRAHDMCSENIEAGSTLLNLINDATFTRSDRNSVTFTLLLPLRIFQL